MPDQPFLIFPRPVPVTRTRLGGGGARITRPTARQQRQRLEAKFQTIAAGLEDIQANVAGMEPELVIVLETFGTSVERVANAAAKIPGLEWLAERDLEDAQPQYGFQNEKDAAATLPVRLYALLTNQQAMNALLGLWEQWTQDANARAKQGYGPFKNLFIYLRDIRRWGPRDRIEATGILQRWLDEIAVKDDRTSAALPFPTTFLGSGQLEVLANYVEQALHRRNIYAPGSAINLEFKIHKTPRLQSPSSAIKILRAGSSGGQATTAPCHGCPYEVILINSWRLMHVLLITSLITLHSSLITSSSPSPTSIAQA